MTDDEASDKLAARVDLASIQRAQLLTRSRVACLPQVSISGSRIRDHPKRMLARAKQL